MKRLLCPIAILILVLCSDLQAQDIHFSQFYNSPSNLGPALTGVHAGDLRFVGNYRSQWHAVPVPYLTFSGAFDMKIFHPRMQNSFFGGGIVLNYDRAGDAALSMAQLGLNGSFTHQLATNHFITLGVQGSFAQRAFKTADLTFDNQFDGEVFNPNLPTREQFDNTNTFFSDFSVGLNWHIQRPDKRTKLDVGGALFHINQPDVSFENASGSNLRNRISVYGMGTIKIVAELDFLLHASAQFQGPYEEKIGGVATRIHLSQQKTKELAVQLGVSYRLDDSIIPNLHILFKTMQVGVSYDVNISDYKVATDQRGGPEVSFTYLIYKVKPPTVLKVCPII